MNVNFIHEPFGPMKINHLSPNACLIVKLNLDDMIKCLPTKQYCSTNMKQIQNFSFW